VTGQRREDVTRTPLARFTLYRTTGRLTVSVLTYFETDIDLGIGAMSKKTSRRRAVRTGGTWTAAKAARHARSYRADLLERYGANPYMRLVTRGQVTAALDQITGVALSRGLTPAEAINLAQLQLGAAPEQGSLEELGARIADATVQAESGSLKVAETYVVSPGMHAVTVAAAETLGHLDLAQHWREDDLPAPHGFLLLSHVQMLEREPPADLRALTWRRGTLPRANGPIPAIHVTGWLAADGPMQFPDFIQARRMAKAAGHPFPDLVPDVRLSFALDPDGFDEPIAERLHSINRELFASTKIGTSHSPTTADFAGGAISDPEANFELRYLYAFMRLCNQRIASIASPPAHTHGALSGLPDEPVRVVQLRTFSSFEGEDRPPSGKKYRHRWIVRMHKVRQWYPGQGTHKVIWRGPYVKGPDGAPLLTGELVNALVR
jgi:hypothetical protein